uniref:STIM1/2 EF-hand domain-containing protein n=1 Tax=Timema bartmani TaxID=61472 RepID=A0A7R9I7R2_9NEOP|nr:unnamed protein product [Timema bartmani]
MHRLTRSVFILCLLISCWFREGKSENVKVSEVRQENSPQESVHKTSENEARVERTSKPSSYSGGSALSRTSSYSSRSDAQSAGIEAGIGENCHDDIVCLSMASNDRIGLEAIRALHRQLDDDANGNVDLSESDEGTHHHIFTVLSSYGRNSSTSKAMSVVRGHSISMMTCTSPYESCGKHGSALR